MRMSSVLVVHLRVYNLYRGVGKRDDNVVVQVFYLLLAEFAEIDVGAHTGIYRYGYLAGTGGQIHMVVKTQNAAFKLAPLVLVFRYHVYLVLRQLQLAATAYLRQHLGYGVDRGGGNFGLALPATGQKQQGQQHHHYSGSSHLVIHIIYINRKTKIDIFL